MISKLHKWVNKYMVALNQCVRKLLGSKNVSKTQYEIHSFEYLSFISKLCVYIKNKNVVSCKDIKFYG